MRNLLVLTALIAASVMTSTRAFADDLPYALPYNANSFQELINITQKDCPTLDCESLSFMLEKAPINELPKDLLAKLREAGVQIAENIWSDTILEGPYEIESMKVHLEKVQVVLFHGYKIGYRITYSAKAKDVDNDIEGRIVESGFVSDNFQQIFRDEKSFADFVRN